jgi:hypothetical protein
MLSSFYNTTSSLVSSSSSNSTTTPTIDIITIIEATTIIAATARGKESVGRDRRNQQSDKEGLVNKRRELSSDLPWQFPIVS